MTESEARALYRAGEDAVVAYLLDISHRVQSVEERLALNSRNSSKPPSSDGLGKPTLKPMPQSLRKKSGKRPGAQAGHSGKTLEQIAEPDAIVTHRPSTCQHCAAFLSSRALSAGYSRRQVFEMPEPKVLVTEHQAVTLVCECCGKVTGGIFPDQVTQPVQYGANLLGFATYLHAAHLIPFARCAKIVQELTGAKFSPGSLHRALEAAHDQLASFEQSVRQTLAHVAVKHVDETGTRVGGKLHWFHVRCTRALCWLFRHEKRGADAVADLLSYSSTLVSDFWSSYVTLPCEHVFCGAHILRELTFIAQVLKPPWATSLIAELESAVDGCHAARERGASVLWDARATARRIDTWVEEGLRDNPLPPKGTTKSKARRLAERLSAYKEDYQRFLFDLSLPFTNNEAERGLRMFKVKGKISGGFRTTGGADRYCRMRSYIATCQKQGMNVLDSIRAIFAGETIMPQLTHD